MSRVLRKQNSKMKNIHGRIFFHYPCICSTYFQKSYQWGGLVNLKLESPMFCRMVKLEAQSCAYRLAEPIPLQSFCCICLHRQGSSLRSELVFRLCKPQKGLGWKFGFASLHILLQSLSERDSWIVNTNNDLI
ncbi:hypothetical protein [Treponema pedis]|uniref:hypothetical protein n=1 Tax=Treponema pedis TaxID=409322 RepID=UPI003133E7E3